MSGIFLGLFILLFNKKTIQKILVMDFIIILQNFYSYYGCYDVQL